MKMIINQLIEHTPCLRRLLRDMDFSTYDNDDDDDYLPSLLSTLIDLEINTSEMADTSKLMSFFQNMPTLRRLRISLECSRTKMMALLKLVLKDMIPSMRVK